MIKRMLRWLLRTIIILIVFLTISHIVNWWSHRVAPGSVIELALKGPVIERGTDGLRGLVDDNQTPLNVARRALRRARKARQLSLSGSIPIGTSSFGLPVRSMGGRRRCSLPRHSTSSSVICRTSIIWPKRQNGRDRRPCARAALEAQFRHWPSLQSSRAAP